MQSGESRNTHTHRELELRKSAGNEEPPKVIHVAREFSKWPGGRYLEDGPFSGQAFRVEHLLPALSQGNEVEIHFDGTCGYTSAFLEEAFGGLVREHGFMADDLLSRLKLVGGNPDYIGLVQVFIEEAGAEPLSK